MTDLIQDVLNHAKAKRLMIATAESCTGGLISSALTQINGSSAVFDRGFVTYSNGAKQDVLGVSPQTLTEHGAVSALVAQQMAEGALARSDADLAVSVTGVAGPEGGTADKPVGLVWFGLAATGEATLTEEHRFGAQGRDKVRTLTVETALKMLLEKVR